MTFIKNLNWRFATKKFDPLEKVSATDIATICKATKLAPSSFGLQPWHVYVIADREIKKKLQAEAAYMQPQVADASCLLVFCGRNDIIKRIDDFSKLNVEAKVFDTAKAEETATSMKRSMAPRSPEAVMDWAKRQAYIALGFALAACSELKIDSCPMEGFDNAKLDKILNLPSHINSVALLAVGYRIEKKTPPKFRFPNNDLFTFI